MKQSFLDIIKCRRSYYSLTNKSPINETEIRKIVDEAITFVPSAFNSQSTRVLLLFGAEHRKLWEIVKYTLFQIVPKEQFSRTEQKIDNSFMSGFGTVLFFEDEATIKEFEEKFPLYADVIPSYSNQTNAMHQFAIWCMLEAGGLGASLQHYNPLIDEKVRETWKLSPDWKLIAQMPFGVAIDVPGIREQKPISERVIIMPP